MVAPLTTIIIPVHNRWDLTKVCLDSLLEHTAPPVDVIVVDDASTDETPTELLRYPVKVIRNETRRSFSENNNQAARIAAGKYLCLLNNDTWVTEGWLEGMLEVAEREENVCVVGNKHLFPKTDLLHHCGMAVASDGQPIHLHPHSDPSLPAANYQRDLEMVTFACCLIPKEWFLKLGGLDESFRNGFEDCDFCLRTREAGGRVVYTPASVIYHYGQQTPGRKVTDNANWELFQKRWVPKITRDLDTITERDRRFNTEVGAVPRRKRLGEEGIHLAIDLSQGSALSWVAAELAVALDAIGEKVSIPRVQSLSDTIEPRLRSKLASFMSDTPRRTFHVKLNHYWPQFLQQEVSGEINAELFVTNYRFRGEIQPLDMWSRNLVLNGVRKLPMSTFCQESLEDLGVAPSKCGVVAPGYSPEIETLFAAPRSPKNSAVKKLFVVTNSHDLNRYGTDLLIPALAEAFSEDDAVEIHIKDYGTSSGSSELKRLVASHSKFPRVVWHEQFLSKEDLIRLYGEMDLLVSPFRGEGYAMKILDAMAVGLPVMMPGFGGPLEYSPAGGFLPLAFDEVPVGRCYDTDNYLVGPGAYWCEVRRDSLVSSLKAYLKDPSQAEGAARVARAHVYGRFTWESAARALRRNLRQWQGERLRKIARRVRPSTIPTSVIIPTKDRPIELEKTLQGYLNQSDQEFEIILVNDHGDSAGVRTLVAPFLEKLKILVIDNHGKNGPGAARNLGIEHAEGEILFITGDDIIPAPDLVERHRLGHKKFPELETAFVGYNDWHPEMSLDWVTRHIVGLGGQQFNYRGMADQQEVPFDRFYTSNISWKRQFTASMEEIFSEDFRFAAFEDTELGYRLSLHGLRLRYLEQARGYHLHPMTAQSFFERMRKVGCMLTVLAGMRPGYVPPEHFEIYKDLEIERRRRAIAGEATAPVEWQQILEPFITAFNEMNRWETAEKPLQGAARSHLGALNHRVTVLRNSLFDNLCDAFVRLGQAQEWGGGARTLDWAPGWISILEISKVGDVRRGAATVPIPASAARLLTKVNHWSLRYESTRKIRSRLRGLKRFVPAELYR